MIAYETLITAKFYVEYRISSKFGIYEFIELLIMNLMSLKMNKGGEYKIVGINTEIIIHLYGTQQTRYVTAP